MGRLPVAFGFCCACFMPRARPIDIFQATQASSPASRLSSLSSCQSMLMLMFTMVSATFVCQTSPIYASERAVSEYQGLIGSHSGKPKYQHLSNVINMLVLARDSFNKH
jgi:hypothetical protein